MNFEKIIKEELSISDNVKRMVSSLLKRFMEIYKGDNSRIPLKSIKKMVSSDTIFELKYMPLFLMVGDNVFGEVYLNVNVFFFPDMDTYDKYWSIANIGGECNGNSVIVNVPCVGGELFKEFIAETLHHEIEHMYQNIMAGKRYRHAIYRKCADILTGEDLKHNSEIYKTIANVIYMLSDIEINANVNGLYSQLMTGYDYNNSPTKSEYENVRNQFESVKTMNGDNNLNDTLAYFGFNFTRFMAFFSRQWAYYQTKVRKVAQRAKNDKEKGISECITFPKKLLSKPIC